MLFKRAAISIGIQNKIVDLISSYLVYKKFLYLVKNAEYFIKATSFYTIPINIFFFILADNLFKLNSFSSVLFSEENPINQIYYNVKHYK